MLYEVITKGSNENNGSAQRKLAFSVASIMVVAGVLLLLADKRIFGNLLIIFGAIGFMNLLFLKRMESWFQDIFLVRLERVYSKVLYFALHGKNLILFFVGTFVLMILTIILFFSRMPDVELFPDSDPNYINVVCELPIGTDITGTNEFVEKLEKDMVTFFEPYKDVVESILSTVGKGDPMDFSAGAKPNQAIVTISFIDYEDRGDVSTGDLMAKLSDFALNRYPGVELEISKDEGGPPTGKPINLEIRGQDFDKLRNNFV